MRISVIFSDYYVITLSENDTENHNISLYDIFVIKIARKIGRSHPIMRKLRNVTIVRLK